jgi:ethanolamine utilization protein EutN
MKIMQVEKTLVSTNRVREMGHRPLLVVREKTGGTRSVAVDAVGCIPGDWVICVGSSAAREAAGAKDFPSDLTIIGIIDHWEEH